MKRQIVLTTSQAANLSSQVFRKAKKDIEVEMKIPNVTSAKEDDFIGKFIKVNKIYLADLFGAIDVLFVLNDRYYIYTIEQTIDGEYCSGFDPQYQHVARESFRKKRRR